MSKKNFSWMNPKLELRDTKRYGKGIFAGENIKRGQIIYVLNGEKISLKELVKRVTSGSEEIDDPLQIGRRAYIDLDCFSRAFNHSCNPNAGIRKKSEMFALKNIKKGEEITYDYSATIAPTVWTMKCKCRSENCRKVLGDVMSIPVKQLRKYKKAGALQDYMKLVLRRLKKDNAGNIILPTYEVIALNLLSKK